VTALFADPASDSHDRLVEHLDGQVREIVRRDGVDPQRDPTVVRRIAEAVVHDHDERSLTGAVAPVPDPAAMVGELVARISGFGPLQQFLDDPTVEEIWINDPCAVSALVSGSLRLPSPQGVRIRHDRPPRRLGPLATSPPGDGQVLSPRATLRRCSTGRRSECHGLRRRARHLRIDRRTGRRSVGMA